MSAASELPYEAWVTALLSLRGMGPARLSELLEHHEAPEIWERLCSGGRVELDTVSADQIQTWRTAARRFDVADRWLAAKRLGIVVAELGATGYPDRLIDDIEPPLLVFRRGAAVSDAPTVGIVGTRQCTSYGRRVAFELGAGLAASGVAVVSGLAIGIDAAAHQGALSVDGAPPVGVVGSGLDVVYPKRNRELWNRVAVAGTILSEAPPGAPPERWRFPARNRIIAGLSDAIVVVESRASGGSLLTVDEAQLRDVPVGAVPGPITAQPSEGTNQLLVEGAVPVVGVADVLGMIGHVAPRADVVAPTPSARSTAEVRCSDLLEALGWSPMLLEQLCLAVSRDALDVAADVEELIAVGACARSGPWIERIR